MDESPKNHFLAIILAVIAVNGVTLNLFTTVWMDEASYTDPAANYALGRGFISTCWFETSREFWSGNTPLHAGLLCLWFRLFDFGMVQTRMFNLLVWSLAVAVICMAVKRLRFVKTSSGLCLLAAILMLGDSITFNYRAGRYDPLMVLLAATALFSFSIPDSRKRLSLLFGATALFLPAAPALGPFAVMSGLWLLLFTRLRYFRELSTAACGLAMGAAALFCFYTWQGTWQSFLHVTAIAKSLNYNPEVCDVFAAKAAALRRIYIQDKSLIIALLILVPACLLNLRRWTASERKLSIACLTFYAVVPTAFLCIYDFPFYYSWMVYLPLCICTVNNLEKLGESSATWKRVSLTSSAALAISFLGLPARIALAADDLPERDYGRVSSFVKSVIRPDDIVFADYQIFYAAHELDLKAYYTFYLKVITEEERDSINCLIINPQPVSETEKIIKQIGGNWQATGEAYLNPDQFHSPVLRRHLPNYLFQNTTRKYNLAVYRRVQ